MRWYHVVLPVSFNPLFRLEIVSVIVRRAEQSNSRQNGNVRPDFVVVRLQHHRALHIAATNIHGEFFEKKKTPDAILDPRSIKVAQKFPEAHPTARQTVRCTTRCLLANYQVEVQGYGPSGDSRWIQGARWISTGTIPFQQVTFGYLNEIVD